MNTEVFKYYRPDRKTPWVYQLDKEHTGWKIYPPHTYPHYDNDSPVYEVYWGESQDE